MNRTIAALALTGLFASAWPAPVVGQAKTNSAVFAGIEAGSLLPVGLEGSYVRFASSGRSHWAVDLRLEPSSYWQSYSLGGSWHVRDRALFVGGRLRRLFLHSPSSRGYDAEVDDHLALSAEVGFRWLPGFSNRRLLITTSAGATHVTGNTVALPLLYNLNLGVGWRVLRR